MSCICGCLKYFGLVAFLNQESLIYNCRGGGDLLGQLHALAEAELKLRNHQKRLSELEAKVILLHRSFCSFIKIKNDIL